jgi:hypothetical protein
MDMRSYSAKDFIKLEDVAEGPLKKVIASIEPGSFDKPAVTFDDGSQLSLNRTSVLALSKAYGWDSDSWIGHSVEIYRGEVAFKGTSKAGVLVRPLDPPTPASARSNPRGDLDDEIKF